MLAMQLKVSPDQALATVPNLPDEEVVALEKAMLAAAMLNASLPETSPVVAKKRSSSELLKKSLAHRKGEGKAHVAISRFFANS